MGWRTRLQRPAGLRRGLIFGVLGVLVYSAPVRIGGFEPPMPWLALIPVFFWAAHGPSFARSAAAFGLGLAQDIVSGGPLGAWALAFMGGYALTATQREALEGQTAAAVWIGFAFCVVAAASLAALGGWVSLRQPPAMLALTAQALITALIAPAAALPLGGLGGLGRARERPA